MAQRQDDGGSNVVGFGGGGTFEQRAARARDAVLGGGSSTAAPSAQQVLVPLWKVRPPAPKSGSGDTGLERYQRTKQVQSGAAYARIMASQMMTREAATRAYLDLSPADREDFRRKAIRAGWLKETDTQEAVMQAWLQWVDIAADWNSARTPDKWISPWEALDKATPKRIAQEGGAYAENGSAIGPFSQTQTDIEQYTLSLIKQNAENILLATLGRGARKGELDRYLKAVNEAAKNSPQVTTKTGRVDEDGREQDVVTTTSGGIDPNQVMTDVARQDPEYAPVQAATTYYEAAMRALDSAVNL